MDPIPRARPQERTLNRLQSLCYVVWGRRVDIFLGSSCETPRGLGSRVVGVSWRRSGIAFRAVSRDASLIFVPRSVFDLNDGMDIILLYVINYCVCTSITSASSRRRVVRVVGVQGVVHHVLMVSQLFLNVCRT